MQREEHLKEKYQQSAPAAVKLKKSPAPMNLKKSPAPVKLKKRPAPVMHKKSKKAEPQEAKKKSSQRRKSHTPDSNSDSEDSTPECDRKPPPRKARKSWVWQHFEDADEEGQVQCIVEGCTHRRTFGTGSTTSLSYHLIHAHGMKDPAEKQSCDSQSKSIQPTLKEYGVKPISKDFEKQLNKKSS